MRSLSRYPSRRSPDTYRASRTRHATAARPTCTSSAAPSAAAQRPSVSPRSKGTSTTSSSLRSGGRIPWPSPAPRRSRTHARATDYALPLWRAQGGVGRRPAAPLRRGDDQGAHERRGVRAPRARGQRCGPPRALARLRPRGREHLLRGAAAPLAAPAAAPRAAPHRAAPCRTAPHRATHSPSVRSSDDARAAAANPAQVMHKCCPAMAGGPGQRVWRAHFSAVSEEAVLTPPPSPRNAHPATLHPTPPTPPAHAQGERGGGALT